jgi:hypothetical protein
MLMRSRDERDDLDGKPARTSSKRGMSAERALDRVGCLRRPPLRAGSGDGWGKGRRCKKGSSLGHVSKDGTDQCLEKNLLGLNPAGMVGDELFLTGVGEGECGRREGPSLGPGRLRRRGGRRAGGRGLTGWRNSFTAI